MKKIELKGGIDVPIKSSSSRWSINLRDLLQGLIMAVLTPVLVIVQQTLDAGHLVFNWKAIGMAAVAGGLAYIARKLPQSGKILIEKSEIEEAKK